MLKINIESVLLTVMGGRIVQTLVVLFIISGVSPALNSTRISEILQSYKKQKLNLAPRNRGEAVNVKVATHILNMVPLNFINEHIYIEVDVIMKWLDRRLMFSNTTDDDVIALQGDATKFFWRPDIFFDGEKGVKQDTFPGQQTSAWIYPDGHIIYTTRVSITVYCPMDFKMFPFDKQICSLRIESWSFNMDSVTLEYFNSTDNSGVSLSDSFRLAKFLLERIEALKFSMDYGISGIFDQLKVVFYLKRDIRFYLMEYYFPIICLVFLSFVSFWIHFKATPARVALPVTTFLTLTKMVAHVRVNMDIYGTAHALETFLNISVLFVFGVIFQFAIVGVTAISWSKKKQRRRIAANNIGVEDDGQPASRKKGIFGILDKTRDFLVAKHRTMEYEVHLLDKVCRYLFPLLYFVFVFMYGAVSFLHLSH